MGVYGGVHGGTGEEAYGEGDKGGETPSSSFDGASDMALALRSVSSVDELEARVRHCDGGDLKKTAMNTVFARGNPRASLMLIGEAPGNEEDRQGKPFVGESGMLLDKILYWAGFDVSMDCYITNMIFWRPPGNRTPRDEEIALCRPFVECHIALVKPKIVLFVGGTAAKHLLHSSKGITQLRQGWHRYHSTFLGSHEIMAKAIFHPAYLLRSPSHKRFVWRDIIDVRAKLGAMD